jgi:hypothetical protein
MEDSIHPGIDRVSMFELWGRPSLRNDESRVGIGPPYIRLPREPQDGISLGFEELGGVRIPEKGHLAREVKRDTSSLNKVSALVYTRGESVGIGVNHEASPLPTRVPYCPAQRETMYVDWAGRLMFVGAAFGESCFFRNGTRSETKARTCTPRFCMVRTVENRPQMLPDMRGGLGRRDGYVSDWAAPSV